MKARWWPCSGRPWTGRDNIRPDRPGARAAYLDGIAAPALHRGEWLGECLDRVGRAGTGLVARPARDIARILSRAAEWLTREADGLREMVVQGMSASSGLSPTVAERTLSGIAEGWGEDKLLTLLTVEFGYPEALDAFGGEAPAGQLRPPLDAPPEAVDMPRGTLRLPVGPRLCLQVTPSNVPGIAVSAIMRSLLVKAPTVVKVGSGDVVTAALFAEALRRVDPDLAAALAVVHWPDPDEELEQLALARASLVVAYGSDDTVAALRDRTPVTCRFVAHHHRVSIGLVTHEALASGDKSRLAREIAMSVAEYDQRGCVSPQAIYVEDREGGDADRLARDIARSLSELSTELPHGPTAVSRAAALAQARATAELLAASSQGAWVRHGGSEPWTVVFGREPVNAPSGVGRFIIVEAVDTVGEALRRVAPLSRHLQSVGIAGEVSTELAEALARAGASRLVPFGEMAFPLPWWTHDGGRPLREMVRWAEVGVPLSAGPAGRELL